MFDRADLEVPSDDNNLQTPQTPGGSSSYSGLNENMSVDED